MADHTEGEARELERLRAAIIRHRSQKADDRCIEDDDELYAALGDGIKCDRRVGDKAAMLANCARFIERRCEGGGWPTYAEMETVVAAAKEWRKQHTARCDCGVAGCVADKALAAAVDALQHALRDIVSAPFGTPGERQEG